MVSSETTKDTTTRRLSITVPSTIVCFARRKEFLSNILCRIVLRNVLSKRSNQKTTKVGLGGPMGSRDEAMKQYKKSGSKWKKELADLKKQNKMLYSIAKKSGSSREVKKIKKIRNKASKRRCDDSRNSSSDKSDSNYSLSGDSD